MSFVSFVILSCRGGILCLFIVCVSSGSFLCSYACVFIVVHHFDTLSLSQCPSLHPYVCASSTFSGAVMPIAPNPMSEILVCSHV